MVKAQVEAARLNSRLILLERYYQYYVRGFMSADELAGKVFYVLYVYEGPK